MHTIAISTY